MAHAQRPGVASALALLICVLAATSHAAFVVETGVLTVQRPEGLGPYDMSVANFGRTIYGGSLRCAALTRLLRSRGYHEWTSR
jgi:hypothetical protein